MLEAARLEEVGRSQTQQNARRKFGIYEPSPQQRCEIIWLNKGFAQPKDAPPGHLEKFLLDF